MKQIRFVLMGKPLIKYIIRCKYTKDYTGVRHPCNTRELFVRKAGQQELEEDEVIDMCQAVREMKDVSRQEGRQEGAIKVYYQKMNYTAEQIAEEMNMDVEDVEKITETLDD